MPGSDYNFTPPDYGGGGGSGDKGGYYGEWDLPSSPSTPSDYTWGAGDRMSTPFSNPYSVSPDLRTYKNYNYANQSPSFWPLSGTNKTLSPIISSGWNDETMNTGFNKSTWNGQVNPEAQRISGAVGGNTSATFNDGVVQNKEKTAFETLRDTWASMFGGKGGGPLAGLASAVTKSYDKNAKDNANVDMGHVLTPGQRAANTLNETAIPGAIGSAAPYRSNYGTTPDRMNSTIAGLTGDKAPPIGAYTPSGKEGGDDIVQALNRLANGYYGKLGAGDIAAANKTTDPYLQKLDNNTLVTLANKTSDDIQTLLLEI